MTIEIEFDFITKESLFYDETVKLRYTVFYEPHNVSLSGVFDEYEDNSIHLVAHRKNTVLGYIRLTIVNNYEGLLTHFVVKDNMRGKLNIASKLVSHIINKAKLLGLKKLFGEVRLPVSRVVKRYGFTVADEIVYSKKTGLPHKYIERHL